MSIKQLNKKSIALINSTQAISSVSSAIKELVENSLDAQAQNIQVNLVDHGLSLIEVKDDGTGISKEDAQFMAWSSYTSKITDFSDLGSLKTYGFRGQALNAACQLSDVTICTKTEHDEAMTCYVLNKKGEIVTSELTHGSTGTIVQVKNLFKNFPVRRNLMKKRLSQEIKDIEMLLKTYSICKPSIGLRLRVNSKFIFSKSICKDVSQAFREVIGAHTFSKLTCIKKSSDQGELVLFVPKKENIDCTGISQNGCQFICINNRPIKSMEIKKLINKRISEYFGQNTSSSSKKFIFCAILAVDQSMLDVNLEPNKDRVLLENMVKKSLLTGIIVKEIDNLLYNVYRLQGSPVFKRDEIANKISDMNLDESEKEEEEPPCKKRKPNLQNQNTSGKYGNTKNTSKTNNATRKSSNHFLKDTDDLEISNSNAMKKKKTQVENRIEHMEFEKSGDSELFNLAQDNSIIEDEFLDVDLGEDSDLLEIINRSKTPLVRDLKEPQSNNSTSSISHHIDEVVWSKGKVPNLQGGVVISNHDVLNSNTSVDLNEEETVVERYPDTTEMNAYKEWKGISPVEINLPTQNESSLYFRHTPRKSKSSLNFSALLSKETQTRVSETEQENNKKQGSWIKKVEVPNGTIKEKSVCWTINPRLVFESCKKPTKKPKNSIVGSLSQSTWIFNWNNQLLVFKITKLHDGLNIKNHEMNQFSAEYVQSIVNKWLNEKNDMSVFHPLHSMN